MKECGEKVELKKKHKYLNMGIKKKEQNYINTVMTLKTEIKCALF